MQVKSLVQRSVDAGQKKCEDIVAQVEAVKAREESTGSLPVPSVPSKRRYEAKYPNITHHRTQADGLLSRKTDHLVVPTSLSEIQQQDQDRKRGSRSSCGRQRNMRKRNRGEKLLPSRRRPNLLHNRNKTIRVFIKFLNIDTNI